MSWSTSELRVRLAPLNRFKPSSKIFYWPFQGGTSFVDLLCFCSVLCLLCLCARLFICALWSPAGKGLTSWLSSVVSAGSLSLSNWYRILGQVWYLIISILDLCTLTYYITLLLVLNLLIQIFTIKHIYTGGYCIILPWMFESTNIYILSKLQFLKVVRHTYIPRVSLHLDQLLNQNTTSLLDEISKVVLLLWIICVIYVLCLCLDPHLNLEWGWRAAKPV